MTIDEVAKKMQGPIFRFEWNLNSVVLLATVVGGLIAWGYTMQGWNETSKDLVETRAEVAALKERQSIIDELRYRITTNETMDKARDDQLDRLSDIITLFRSSFAEVNTKLEVLTSKLDIVGDAVKEQRKQQGVTR